MALVRTIGQAVFSVLFGVLFSGAFVLLAMETMIRRYLADRAEMRQ